jgi:hypothetical protein
MRRLYLEDVLRSLAVAGAVAFVGVLVVALLGLATNLLAPFFGSTLPFLFGVLIVTAPYAELMEVRQRRLRRLPTAERLGFVVHDAAAR